ncbi:ELAV-like protein 3 [Hydractinia symbiolongicarpus]|uniref:ELAV-like protein 3 n=1 Tax=Hydractinia symbiolongicarpus TaxID=13093 RepID=UPI0025513AE0|nr:ELAV-like protein 3 [Hydractinia symbiolongicarpus]
MAPVIQTAMYLQKNQLIINQEELDTNKLDEDDTRTNLIINYLPQEMTEEELRTLFSSVGSLESCKLIRDKVTKASLGYAFVNYQDPRDARKAIRSLQGMKLTTKTIKVSYARPSSNEIKNANLYISGLPQTCDAVRLRELFQNFGEIITSKVLVDENGESRGVGFVRFDKRRQAEQSIEALNNKVPNLHNAIKPLTVKFANPPSQKIQSYVDILSQAKAGIATAGYLQTQGLYSPLSGAIIPGTTPGSASTAVPTSSYSNGFPTAHNSVLNGMPQQSMTSWCVFVYNLPSDASDLTLFQLFSKHGAIHSVRVITDHEKKCRGYGFVNMVHYDDAVAAIFRLNGYCLERGKPLQVSLKRPKSIGAMGIGN